MESPLRKPSCKCGRQSLNQCGTLTLMAPDERAAVRTVQDLVIHERFKIMIRAESNKWPLKLPELLLPNAICNSNSANLFGTFTSLRNPFVEPGMSRPHAVVGGRVEF